MQAGLGDWPRLGCRPLGNSSLSEGTISSGGDGNEHRAIAAKPRDAEARRLPLRKERAHGSRISGMPVRQGTRADTGHVLGGGDSGTLTCERERGLRMEPPRGRPPATEEDDGQKEEALRVRGGSSSGANGTRRDCSQTEPFRTPRFDSSRDSSRPNKLGGSSRLLRLSSQGRFYRDIRSVRVDID